MKKQIKTAVPAENLCWLTVTMPAKRLLGIAANRCAQIIFWKDLPIINMTKKKSK